MRGALIAAAFAVTLPTGLSVTATASKAQSVRTLLVIPFENKDPRLIWLREGAALIITDYLDAAGDNAIDRDERLRAFDRLQLPAMAVLSRASSIKVGQAVGATEVVTGRFEVIGEELVAHARIIQLESGRILPEVEVRGAAADVFGVFGRLAQRINGSAAPMPSPGDRLPLTVSFFEL
jgi:hypothetical protein